MSQSISRYGGDKSRISSDFLAHFAFNLARSIVCSFSYMPGVLLIYLKKKKLCVCGGGEEGGEHSCVT